MSRFIALITDRFDVNALASLQGDSELTVRQSSTPLPTKEEMLGVQGIVIRSRTKITAEFLNQSPDLKVIVTSTSGFDHIDLKACQEKSVVVMYTPTANAASAAELTWALSLAVSRKTNQADRAVKSGDWKRETLLGRQLHGRTYGIVGLGRIGSRVAKIANAFGMRVVGFDPYKDDHHFDAAGCERMSLDEVFKMADIVSIHVPSTTETFHMIRKTTLDEANRDLVLINTSRGAVVDEKVLCEALDKGWIAGAGLDVFKKEPLPRESKLLGRDNVVLTPHIGATTGEAFQASSMEAAAKLKAFAARGEIKDRLPGNEAWVEGGFIHRE
ncbi:MAG: hydroxyacid dehydrogenase [Bdellovibrionota bacterium]